jgi:hypothetical protein
MAHGRDCRPTAWLPPAPVLAQLALGTDGLDVADAQPGLLPGLEVCKPPEYRHVSSLRGCPETSQPRCEAFKPLFGDIGKQDKVAVKAC